MPGLLEVCSSLHPCPQGPPQGNSKLRRWGAGTDNLPEKSSWLAPPILHQPPQSWSLPTEGAPESFSLGMYAPLKNTLHSRSALASSDPPHLPLWGLHTPVNTASDPICSVHCQGSPVSLTPNASSHFRPPNCSQFLLSLCSCCFPPPGLCEGCPGCLECSFPSHAWKLLHQAPADPSIYYHR